MPVTGPDFISIQVRDLAASQAFYERYLGLVRSPQGPPHAVVFATEPIAFALRDVVEGTDLDAGQRPGVGVALWLHATDVQALAAILDADVPMTPKRLREHLGLTSGAVTACVDRLERAGHVRRVRESADRRVVHLYYAADARGTARSYFRPLAVATEAALSRFTAEELAVVLRFLAAMNEELGAGAEHSR